MLPDEGWREVERKREKERGREGEREREKERGREGIARMVTRALACLCLPTPPPQQLQSQANEAGQELTRDAPRPPGLVDVKT